MIVKLSTLSINRYHGIKRMFDSGHTTTAENLAQKTVRMAPKDEQEKLRLCFAQLGLYV